MGYDEDDQGGKELEEIIALAEQGQAAAQNLLAVRLATGDGVAVDIAGALYWYLQAAKAGYVHAMWNAGSMLVDGEGGLRADLSLGMNLIERAAACHENSACLFLAMCYREGKYGRERDETRAGLWEAKAWDRKKFKEFDSAQPLNDSYALHLPKPTLRPTSTRK